MTKRTDRCPVISSDVGVCPIPFRFDTYTGCTFGCKYCFAASNVEHLRSLHHMDENERKFEYLTCADTKKFESWVRNTLKGGGKVAERFAFRDRLVLKIGGAADPFPYVEREEGVTKRVLEVLHDIDYPVQISTKNPSILADYAENFKNPNWSISVSIVSPSEDYRKVIETNAPTIGSRLKHIRRLSEMGHNVIARVQPVIFPYTLENMEELFELLHDAHAYGVIMEGLRIRVSMPELDREKYAVMSKFLGYDIRKWMKDFGDRSDNDYEFAKIHKLMYLGRAKELASKMNMKLYVGENNCRSLSCNKECCGTENLRNHKTIHECDEVLNMCPKVRSHIKSHTPIRELIKEGYESHLVY